tara:strand:+ start:111 stop:749 length:639 start_codon:yes stop_codon:yes gene_type:complete
MNKADRYVIPEGAERPKKKYLKKYLPEDKPLNRREELFVKELVAKDGQITLRDAAINAGYPPKSAHVRAHELTNPAIKPNVVKAIKQFRAELDQKYGVEYKRHLRDLQVIRDAALDSGAFSAAVQAEYRRGQAQGDIYVNKSEIRHGTIDSMSKEEVLNAIKELKQTYDPVTIDITPVEESDKNRDKARKRVLGSVSEESNDTEEVLEDGKN